MTTKTRSQSSKKAAAVKQNPTVHIVGFAPSWQETPWDSGADLWGMNALHKVAGDKPWTRWYQLHDLETHHKDDMQEHVGWMVQSGLPLYMWEEHITKYQVPNAIPFPREEVVEMFGGYFTNTVSWMIAHAIYEGREKIGVYGVDMAQDSEYGHQRPSCEYFLGWAQGLGIEIDIPESSDLLKSPYLYGIEDHSPMRNKLVRRQAELQERRQQIEGQLSQLNNAHQQVLGALEDVQYLLRTWTIEGAGNAQT